MSSITRVIYVISDLHLGGAADPGKRGFRICTHEVELAAFVHSLTLLNNNSPRIELVINGDMVDFLAERTTEINSKWSAFHYPENNAIQILDRIVQRSALVFEALQRFLARGHRLVILPGNHDIELNLPAVRNRLREHVGAKYGGDYEFIGRSPHDFLA